MVISFIDYSIKYSHLKNFEQYIFQIVFIEILKAQNFEKRNWERNPFEIQKKTYLIFILIFNVKFHFLTKKRKREAWIWLERRKNK